MFVSFFHELKSAGVPVTLREYLTLMEAMQADLASRRVEEFYYLSRAALIKEACYKVVAKQTVKDPIFDIAQQLQEVALNDPYFIERKLYPSVDFYSGIMMRAIGIPVEMFTVIFAIGRMPGWIANFREVMEDNETRIYRPRQVYTGATLNHYTAIKERK